MIFSYSVVYESEHYNLYAKMKVWLKIRNTFKNIWIGIVHAIKMPSLPESVNKLHTHALTRLFRVLGGLCILLVLSKSLSIENSIFYYLVFTLALLQFTYVIIINIIKFFYILYLWKNNKFQVRNSPLNRIASFSANLIACVKGTCVLGLSGGTALGLGLGLDELLASHGRDTVFKNTLGKGLDNALDGVGFKNPNKDITNTDDNIKNLKYRFDRLKALSTDMDDLDSVSQEAGIKDSDFINQVKKDIKDRIQAEKTAISNSKSKILSELTDKDSFNTKKNK